MAPWLVYNIGNNHPIKLMDYIEAIENALGKKAEKVFVPLQPAEEKKTYADIQDLVEQFNYKPSTSLEEGIMNFVSWYRKYYEI